MSKSIITAGGSGSNKLIVTILKILGKNNLLTFDFNYKGAVEEFEVPITGLYKLEVWGGSGGYSLNGGSKGSVFAKGGYSVGYKVLQEGTKLYIAVGGVGTNGTRSANAPGGWNGGGYGTWDGGDDEASGGGGGETHIATITGTLESIGTTNKNKVLIVAGGGGGCSYNHTVGAGGGTSGGNGDVAQGGTQTTGFKFGRGQDASGVGDSDGVGGGGGGWYGGYMSNTGGRSSGGGGSGYIGGTPSISWAGTTYSPTTTAGQWTGNGKCTISIVDIDI